MATLKELAGEFLEKERPVGVLIMPETVESQAIAAASFYLGYALIHNGDNPVEPTQFPDITLDTDIDPSEWAVIRPLFLLYVERETALQLEATRGLGADPYGRSSSEVAADITQYEAALPQKAFAQPFITL